MDRYAVMTLNIALQRTRQNVTVRAYATKAPFRRGLNLVVGRRN